MWPSIIFKVLTPESEDKPWRSIKPGYNWLLNSILQYLLIDNLSPSCRKCNVTNHFGAAGKSIRMAPQEQVYLPARAQWPTADPCETHGRLLFLRGEKALHLNSLVLEKVLKITLKITNTLDKKTPLNFLSY